MRRTFTGFFSGDAQKESRYAGCAGFDRKCVTCKGCNKYGNHGAVHPVARQPESCVKFFENSFPFEGKWSILNNTVNAEYIPLWYEQTSPDMVSGSR